ncbi:MAG: hypothetical protein R3321_04570 [Nitrososphaeraceae archaeon]|nr:hypothetical protein [Nitrososphaeraceae archaeon]
MTLTTIQIKHINDCLKTTEQRLVVAQRNGSDERLINQLKLEILDYKRRLNV